MSSELSGKKAEFIEIRASQYSFSQNNLNPLNAHIFVSKLYCKKIGYVSFTVGSGNILTVFEKLYKICSWIQRINVMLSQQLPCVDVVFCMPSQGLRQRSWSQWKKERHQSLSGVSIF